MQLNRYRCLFLAIVSIWLLIILTVHALKDFLVIEKPLHHAETLAVLAGSKDERLPAAARLYKEGKASKILLADDGVFSAYSEEKHRNLFQVEWAEYDLLRSGVPANAIIKLSHTSSGTIHDALNARSAALSMGFKSILIVTSDYHTKRSLWTFQRVFRDQPITIGIYPVRSDVTASPYSRGLIPLYREMVKYLYYIVRFRNP